MRDEGGGGRQSENAAMAHAGVAIVVVGRHLFDGFAAFVHQHLLGFAAGADRDLHQPLNGGRREVVERRDGDMEEEGEERNEADGPVTDRCKRNAVDMCPHDHES